MGLRAHRRGRRQRRGADGLRQPALRGRAALAPGRCADRADLRALRRAVARAAQPLDHRPLRSRRARRAALRARCERRQGQLPAAAARRLRPRPLRRPAGARTRAAGGRGGSRWHGRPALHGRGRAPRRLRDRLRRHHGGRAAAGAARRRARRHRRPRARAHREPRPPLGRLRRRGTERAARAHEDARRGRRRPRRPAA